MNLMKKQNRKLQLNPKKEIAIILIAGLAIIAAWAAFHATFGWPFGRWL